MCPQASIHCSSLNVLHTGEKPSMYPGVWIPEGNPRILSRTGCPKTIRMASLAYQRKEEVGIHEHPAGLHDGQDAVPTT